ncbi:MAG: formylglycine-generating enzyme family protein, partial [Thermoguttaceae bacterium]|nr:formylglycine-generating enzyme family protein [Thermoguttaceae bacterium]
YKLFEAGNRTEALTKVESALELDPGNVGALLLKRSLKESPSPSVSTMASTSNREALPVPDRRTSPEPGSTTTTSKLGEGQTAGEKKTLNIKGIDYTFCWCPAGSFTMGSPETEKGRSRSETQHEVTLSRGFWLLESEVTQEMWESVMGNNPSSFKGAKLPVEKVSWEESKKFCEELSTLSGESMRLPSEAQWEYACRAGTSSPYSFGGALNGDKANCNGNYPYGTTEEGKYLKRTREMKSYSPNAWGLYDMHGNVWEWCQDWYGDYPNLSVTDPTGQDSGSSRVLRGGGWSDDAGDCRSAYRDGNDPGYRRIVLGFRLALSSASPSR